MKTKRFYKKSGATFIEYAMLAGLIAIVVAIAAAFFGRHVRGVFTGAREHAQQLETHVKDAKIDGDFNEGEVEPALYIRLCRLYVSASCRAKCVGCPSYASIEERKKYENP